MLQGFDNIGDRDAEMIGKGLKLSNTMRHLVLVMQFYHRIALNLYHGKSGVQLLRVVAWLFE
jgi:hypothetical protein